MRDAVETSSASLVPHVGEGCAAELASEEGSCRRGGTIGFLALDVMSKIAAFKLCGVEYAFRCWRKGEKERGM